MTLSLVMVAVLLAQNGPALEITSPAKGTVFRPGQTIDVTVTSPSRTTFLAVIVVGEQPIGESDVASSLPAHFRVAIPESAGSGEYAITALGTTPSGATLESESIVFRVERSEFPQRLWVQSSRMYFSGPGATLPTELLAIYPDGQRVDVTRSSQVTYVSSNAGIVTVNREGVATSVAPGNATLTMTYRQGTQHLDMDVVVQVSTPSLAASAYSVRFDGQRVGTVSAPREITLTNIRLGPVRIISIKAVGEFLQSNDCPASLPPGGSCYVSITFATAAGGEREGTLAIANGFDNLPSNLLLRGLAFR